jgi:hypothetical protein
VRRNEIIQQREAHAHDDSPSRISKIKSGRIGKATGDLNTKSPLAGSLDGEEKILS